MPRVPASNTTLKTPGFTPIDTRVETAKYDVSGAVQDVAASATQIAGEVVDIRNREAVEDFRNITTAMRDTVANTERGSDRENTVQQLDLGASGPVFRQYVNDFKRIRGRALQMGTGPTAQEYAANTGEAMLKQFTSQHPELAKEAVAVMRDVLGVDPTGSIIKFESKLEQQNMAVEADAAKQKSDNLTKIMLKYNLDSSNANDLQLYIRDIKPIEDKTVVAQARLSSAEVRDNMSTLDADNFVRNNIAVALLEIQVDMQAVAANFNQQLRDVTDPGERLKVTQAASQTYSDMERVLENKIVSWKAVIQSNDANEIAAALNVSTEDAKTILEKVKVRGTGPIMESLLKSPEIKTMRAEIAAGKSMYSNKKIQDAFQEDWGANAAAMFAKTFSSSPATRQLVMQDKFLSNIVMSGSFTDKIVLTGRAYDALEQSAISLQDEPARFVTIYNQSQSIAYEPSDPALNDKRRDRAISDFAQNNQVGIDQAANEFKLTDLTVVNTGLKQLNTNSTKGNRDTTIDSVGKTIGMMWSASNSDGSPTYTTKERAGVLRNVSTLPIADTNKLFNTIGAAQSRAIHEVSDGLSMAAFDRLNSTFGDTNYKTANIIYNPNNGAVGIHSPVFRGTGEGTVGTPIPTRDLESKLSHSIRMLTTAVKSDYNNSGLTDAQVGQLVVGHLQANGYTNVSYGNPLAGL